MRIRIFTGSINLRDSLKAAVPDAFIFNIQTGSFDVDITEALPLLTWALEKGVTYQEIGDKIL